MKDNLELVAKNLADRGIDMPTERVEGGMMAWVTLGSENWILQRRSIDCRPRLEALSEWTTSHRDTSDLLAGTEMTVVGEDDLTYWALTPRLDTPTLAASFVELSEWERFELAWPDMIETIKATEQLAEQLPPPPLVGRPPNNCGTVMRRSSIRTKAESIALEGINLNSIRGLPGACLEGKVSIYHGDLSYRNMVDTGNGYRAVDWEMTAMGPVSVEFARVLSWHLIWELNPDRWVDIVEFAMPGMIEVSDLSQRDLISAIFWGVVADACLTVYYMEHSIHQDDYLIRGLQKIADLARSSRAAR